MMSAIVAEYEITQSEGFFFNLDKFEINLLC